MRPATEDDLFTLEGLIRGGPTKVRVPRATTQGMPQPVLPPYPKAIVKTERRLNEHRRRPKRLVHE